ncbi:MULTISPECIES: hypothetical protein [Vibrio]|jgi:hypothetical protein|uniref:hypothetical protein n=1 Tax=Vibrio TaxID=662 RepID=UPI001380308F|nr:MULTISPECIES: hypothetical protein [Vibrio]EJR0948794.1 hypothetical protein [Vibrio alginolyticus]MCS0084968.1 hypothetical protein [Vibrio alginolyticus]NAW82322.1 hypothetical protein [Vibrio sp. V43_P6S15P86]
MMILVLLWVFLAFVLAIYAKSNGRSFGWWLLLGLVIDPILAWIIYKVVAD